MRGMVVTEESLSKEERILRAVKFTLTGIIKDTATPPGMRHPLSDETLVNLRDCLALISEREQELAEQTGQPSAQRPRFTDEPSARTDVVIPLDQLRKAKKDPSGPQ